MKNYVIINIRLWYKSHIKIENRPIFYQQWFRKGIRNINDVLNDNGDFSSMEELQNKYGIKTNFLTYQSFKIKIVEFLKRHNFVFSKKLIYPNIPQNIDILLLYKKRYETYV